MTFPALQPSTFSVTYAFRCHLCYIVDETSEIRKALKEFYVEPVFDISGNDIAAIYHDLYVCQVWLRE